MLRLAEIETVDLGQWAKGKHRTTEDAPCGGGPGLVMKIEPIHRALAVLIFTDAVVRLISGVLGDEQSAVQESFSSGLIDHPHHTRLENFNRWIVPPVLLSGNHAAMAGWRKEQALEVTKRRWPDLL